MPTIIDNTQSQNSTISDNGRNVRPALQAISHFILRTDDGISYSVSQNNSFGAVSSTSFRTTSTFTFNGVKEVFLACKGQVLLQPNAQDSNKINLILKPFEQPIKGLSIKYFVYRGLTKSDFLSVSDTLVGSETTGTGFVKFLWKEFNQFYSSENQAPGSTTPPFSGTFIGYPDNGNQLGTTLIDNLFYKISDTVINETTGEAEESSDLAFELPIVPRGKLLGTVTNELGIDIVLNEGDYYIENDSNPFQLNLDYARVTTYMLDTSVTTDAFLKKLINESCIRFMDIAAFYGLHANGNGKVFKNTETLALTSADDIYNLMDGFYTKNTQYFYIQSSRQRSYNFYGNYVYSDTNSNNLKIGTAENNLSETVYGDNGWPLHKINNQEFTYFQFTTDNHGEAALFAEIGILATNHENNFVRNVNLLQQASEDPNVAIDFAFTNSVGFKFNKSGTDGIASLVKIIYEGKQLIVSEDVSTGGNEQFVLKDIDDVFGLLNAQSFLAIKNQTEYPSVIDEQLQVINFTNALKKTDAGVVKLRRIADAIKVDEDNDLERITFETLLVDSDFNDNTFINNNAPLKEGETIQSITYNKEQNNFYKPKKPFSFSTVLFTDSGSTITGVILEQEQGKLPAKKILGMSLAEYQKLLDLIDTNNLFNAKLFFRNLLDNDEDYFLSIEDVQYKSYTLDIIAENISGELFLFCLNEDVRLYSVDDRVYFSSAYSNNIDKVDLDAIKLPTIL